MDHQVSTELQTLRRLPPGTYPSLDDVGEALAPVAARLPEPRPMPNDVRRDLAG